MAKTFGTFDAALTWGRTYGREHTFPFQIWRVVRKGRDYAIGIFSRNTGKLEGFAHA